MDTLPFVFKGGEKKTENLHTWGGKGKNGYYQNSFWSCPAVCGCVSGMVPRALLRYPHCNL